MHKYFILKSWILFNPAVIFLYFFLFQNEYWDDSRPDRSLCKEAGVGFPEPKQYQQEM